MVARYRDLCRQHIGKRARIHTKDGKMYDGMIARVCPTHVLLMPMARGVAGGINEGHNEVITTEMNGQPPVATEVLFGWWIPFVAIAALALFPFFFWW